MDDPKKAAKKLLQFYQGEKLKELLEYLNKGLESSPDTRNSKNTSVSDRAKKTIQDDSQVNDSFVIDDSPKPISVRSQTNIILNNKDVYSKPIPTETSKISEEKTTSVTSEQTKIKNNPHNSELTSQVGQTKPRLSELNDTTAEKPFTSANKLLNTSELAQRLNVIPNTITNYLNKHKNPEKFKQWTKNKDPDGIAWQKKESRKGRSSIFEPVEKVEQKETP